MPQNNAFPQEFIEEAATLLSANQKNLQILIERVDQGLEISSNSQKNGREELSVADLQSVQEQMRRLARQNEVLQKMLENSLEGTSQGNHLLSRVQLFQRQEEEKARTAKDLEDTIAQPIANAIFELAAVKGLLAVEDSLDLVTDGIDALQEELEQSLTDLRILIADLEPGTILGNFGLVAGLRRYLEKFEEQTGLDTELQVQTLIEPLPNTIEIAIFRVIQEALQNIRQHAAASRVEVSVREENGNLKFTVFDDGTGLTPNLAKHSQRQLGLVSMKEIADLLEGSLDLRTEKNRGTQVILTVPYPKF